MFLLDLYERRLVSEAVPFPVSLLDNCIPFYPTTLLLPYTFYPIPYTYTEYRIPYTKYPIPTFRKANLIFAQNLFMGLVDDIRSAVVHALAEKYQQAISETDFQINQTKP